MKSWTRWAPQRWNHNTHYHPRVLGTVPPGCRRSLGVGCGEGLLARELRQVVPFVTGIDRDAASIELARRLDEDIEFILGDFMTHPFEPATFDHIASIAVLHHLDTAGGVGADAQPARAGRHAGDRRAGPQPLPRRPAVRDRRGRRPPGPPAEQAVLGGIGPEALAPPETFAETRRLAERVLPGVRYRRLLLFRYALLWIKPA